MNVCLKHRSALEGILVWLANCVNLGVEHKVVLSPQMCIQLCADCELNKHDDMLPAASTSLLIMAEGLQSMQHARCTGPMLRHIFVATHFRCRQAFAYSVQFGNFLQSQLPNILYRHQFLSALPDSQAQRWQGFQHSQHRLRHCFEILLLVLIYDTLAQTQSL